MAVEPLRLAPGQFFVSFDGSCSYIDRVGGSGYVIHRYDQEGVHLLAAGQVQAHDVTVNLAEYLGTHARASSSLQERIRAIPIKRGQEINGTVELEIIRSGGVPHVDH